MTSRSENPSILIVTPEVSHLPAGMSSVSGYISAKAGGVADVTAGLITALFEQGADVHVALPDYRRIFRRKLPPAVRRWLTTMQDGLPEQRIHLARDRGFYHLDRIPCGTGSEDINFSLYFQREIINAIIPRVQPDLIHCHDWMTGLIPAAGRRMDIPCLFTIHNLYTAKRPLSHIEDIGIDAAFFWPNLYYDRYPSSYEESRNSNPVDLLLSGVFAAHYVNTVSPTFLSEIINGRHTWVDIHLQRELRNKWESGCAAGILNAPDPSYNPMTDKALFRRYGVKDHRPGKKYNKLFLEQKLGLDMDSSAPIFFWPSRLDPIQKGYSLLAEILFEVVSAFREQNLQIVFVADGEFRSHFEEIVKRSQLYDRVAISPFDERLARQAYAGADFVLMPSRFEPCGLPQMIGPLYGTLPVAFDTGGLHDTVTHMNAAAGIGNGFLFENYDSKGLFWAFQEAMAFYGLPAAEKSRQIERIMTESLTVFNPAVTASQYVRLYERMLERPLNAIETMH